MKIKDFFSYLFIPQEKNNNRAGILHINSLLIFVAFYFLSQTLIHSFSVSRPGVLGYSSEITIEKVFQHTNIQREKNNLDKLHYNSQLSQAAEKKALHMFKENYWAHTSPKGVNPWQFFKQVNYNYIIAGENLAKDFYDTDTMMSAWMKSPTHRDNILNTKYREIGIAVVNGVLNGVETTLVVQHFASPASGIITDNTQDEVILNSTTSNVLDAPESNVLSAQQTNKINPISLSKTFASIIFIIIIVALFIDGYLTMKNGTYRLRGSSFGHLGFLIIIFLLMIFTRQGTVF